MSSLANDNVSESKTQQHEITDNQANTTETTTNVKIATKNNQLENIRSAATISNNDNSVKNEVDENTYKNIKTTNKTESEQRGINSIITTTKNLTTATSSNKDNNESNNDVVVAADKDENVTANDKFNTADDNKLKTAQISTNPVETALCATANCVPLMTPGSVEPQQVLRNKNMTENSTTYKNEEIPSLPVLTTSALPSKEDKSVEYNCEIRESNFNSSFTTGAKIIETSTLPPLSSGLTSSIACSHLQHISSEPIFSVQINKNLAELQRNTNSNSNTKPYSSGNTSCETVGRITLPSMVRKASESSVMLPRRVSFPKSDKELVTGYLEPANPWEYVLAQFTLLLLLLELPTLPIIYKSLQIKSAVSFGIKYFISLVCILL